MTTINQIVTMACNISKVKKADCLGIVHDFIESGNAPDENQLAQLYSFFLPPVPANPKTPLDWIRKAVADNKEVRYYLHYIYSEDGVTISTDGHRMHMADNIDQTSEPGFYSPHGVKVDVDAKYPDWKRVVPAQNTSQTVTLADCECRDLGNWGVAVNVIGATWINRKYLLDAVGKDAEFIILNANTCQDGTSAVLLQCQFGKAVIMPMRV